MEAERDHLTSLSAWLRERLCCLGFDCGPSGSHIVPLIIGGTEAALDLAAALQSRADFPFDLFVLPVSLTKGEALRPHST